MLLKPSKIVLAQTSSVLGDVRRNVARHVELAERAIAEQADAIIFPELSLSGYTLRDLNFEVALQTRTSALLDPLRELSKKITIICGAVEEDERGAVYNSALLIEDGEVRHTHRKVYPPTYGMFEEGRYFRSGHEAMGFDSSRLGRIGLLVCEDLWHPALPYVEALDDAQLIIAIAASPTRLGTGEIGGQDARPTIGGQDARPTRPENYEINREHHAAYARLLSVFLVFVNRVGVEDGVNFWGGSEVVSPSGETIARAKFFEEDFVVCQIDPEQVRQSRQLSRHFLDDSPLLTRHLIEKLMERK